MTKIVSLQAVRDLKKREEENPEYRSHIESLDKLQLLEEMVRFQEERSQKGHLTLEMMVRGKILFAALEKSAETQELRLLTGSYKKHLEFEMKEYARGPELYVRRATDDSIEADLGPELDFDSER